MILTHSYEVKIKPNVRSNIFLSPKNFNIQLKLVLKNSFLVGIFTIFGNFLNVFKINNSNM